jgi:hypothetical protein
VGLSIIKNKQTIAIAVKYPMRSAAIVISIPPLGMMLQLPAALDSRGIERLLRRARPQRAGIGLRLFRG